MGHPFFMKLILSTHNVTLTKAIEDHVVNKLDKLEHLGQRMVDARVTLEHDHTRVPEKQFAAPSAWACAAPTCLPRTSKATFTRRLTP